MKSLGLEKNTLIVFSSDNGPLAAESPSVPKLKEVFKQFADPQPSSVHRLRGYKGTNYWEGGPRVPTIFNWPGVIPPGAECHEVTGGMDLFTTFANLAGVPIPTDRSIDGKDLMPLLRGEPNAKSPHEAFFSYGGARLGGVRKGKWKLCLQPNQPPRLYDLDQDIREAHDRPLDLIPRCHERDACPGRRGSGFCRPAVSDTLGSSMKLALFIFCALPTFAATCESLASLSLPNTKITASQSVSAGSFAPPKGAAKAFKAVPEFCRVTATLAPSSDSDIKVEVWLPASAWNHKLQAVGNGGWAGVISYAALAEAVKAGYAAVSTDTGHSTAGGAFALGHPEKLIDFSWRSEHEMTVKAKALIQAFYGGAPQRSYWNGCSTGGRQALKEAQMFPDDFDGIIAGAPGNRNLMALWIAQALLKDPPSHIPPAKFPVIHQAALDACDASDGLKDGLIEDPTRCKFDPGVLLCKGADGPDLGS